MSIFSRQGKNVPTDMMKPRPVGVDDRSGFLFYLDDLPFQYQYRGNALVNLNIRTGARFLDKPSEFLRPPLIGPDPIPPRYPRPTHYTQQNAGGTEAPSVQEIEDYVGSNPQ